MKAILVIDMPQTCNDCDYRFIATDNSNYCGLTKAYMNRATDTTKEKDVRCPLKPMPEKKEEYIDSNYVPMIGYPEKLRSEYNVGWNACIEEIENEQNR